MADRAPLVLGVDGTFLKTGLQLESLWAALGRDPLGVVRLGLRRGTTPAARQAELARLSRLRTDLLPVHPEIASLARDSRAAGREVVLASGSDAGQVAQLARDHDLSPRVFASREGQPLPPAERARALQDAYGPRGFDYAGCGGADRPIWQAAQNALLVGRHPRLERRLSAEGHSVSEYDGGWAPADLFRALRPHQWVKNVLLLLPMIAAHAFDLPTLQAVLLGIAAFSVAASAIYVANDLLDLEADRLHRTKRLRPFASGAVPLGAGMAAGLGMLLLALVLGALLGAAFLAAVCGYMALSLAYSLRLKRLRWIDVFTLATLYTLRVVAGAAAGGVEVSIYMLIFVFPVFLSLGCVKRMTELARVDHDRPLPGRGYGRPDRGDLLNMAVLGVVGSLVIFTLYAFSGQGSDLYPTRWILLVALVPMAMWQWRMVRLGYYGRMDYDPIVFALRDRRGLGLLMIVLSLMFYAAGLWQRWFG